MTRHDFGDLDTQESRAYAEFPDAKTRVVESVTVAEVGQGLELTVKDHYENFAGAVRWLIDKDGVGKISYDYTYTGDDFDSREIGIRPSFPPNMTRSNGGDGPNGGFSRRIQSAGPKARPKPGEIKNGRTSPRT